MAKKKRRKPAKSAQNNIQTPIARPQPPPIVQPPPISNPPPAPPPPDHSSDLIKTLIYDVTQLNHEVAKGNVYVANLNREVAEKHVQKLENGPRIFYSTCPFCQSFLQLFPDYQKCIAVRNEVLKTARRESMLPQIVKARSCIAFDHHQHHHSHDSEI